MHLLNWSNNANFFLHTTFLNESEILQDVINFHEGKIM